MTENIKSQLENAAENLSIEFQRVLINEMSTEEGLVPVLMDIGSDPARYINIFSDEIIRLGAAYYNGQGEEQDLNEAIKWYKKAADLGHGVARWNLETIARQGHAGAQYNVGLLYHEGIGIKQNNVTAYAWWDNAATNGYQDAKEKKTIITERITPAQIVKAEELVLEMTKNHPKLLNK